MSSNIKTDTTFPQLERLHSQGMREAGEMAALQERLETIEAAHVRRGEELAAERAAHYGSGEDHSGELERLRATVAELEEALDLGNAELVRRDNELNRKDRELASERAKLQGMTARAGMLEKQAEIEAEVCQPPCVFEIRTVAHTRWKAAAVPFRRGMLTPSSRPGETETSGGIRGREAAIPAAFWAERLGGRGDSPRRGPRPSMIPTAQYNSLSRGSDPQSCCLYPIRFVTSRPS